MRKPNWENLVGRQRSTNSRCGRVDVRVGTQRDDPGLVLVARLLNTVFDKSHVLLESKKVGLVADPVDTTDTIAGRPAASSPRTLGAFTLKDTPHACSLLARDDPPLCLADRLLQGRVDNLEHVSDSHAVWVFRNGDPGVQLRDKTETGDGGIDSRLVELRVARVRIPSEVHLGFARPETDIPDDASRCRVKDGADERMGLGIKVDGFARAHCVLTRVRVRRVAESPRRHHNDLGRGMRALDRLRCWDRHESRARFGMQGGSGRSG